MGIDTFGVAMSCAGAWVVPQPREHNEDCQRIPPSPLFYGAWETTEEKVKKYKLSKHHVAQKSPYFHSQDLNWEGYTSGRKASEEGPPLD